MQVLAGIKKMNTILFCTLENVEKKILNCSYGARFRKGAVSITYCLIDTVSNGILLDGTAAFKFQ